ncbi:hypothetical protein F5888DRAFT_370784 [Russula emetica]|nr:hypothetical protein F5888DRAFT_370784 [Russula emetica]
MTECDGKKFDVFFLLFLSKELNLIWFVRGDETTVLEYCRVRLAGRAEWDAQMLYSSTASDRCTFSLTDGGNQGPASLSSRHKTSSRTDLRELLMIGRGRPPPLFPKKLNSKSVACAWNQQIRLHNDFVRSLRGTRSPISLHAKLGLPLASFLSLVAVGCSLSQLNLDTTQERESFVVPTQDNSGERRQHVRALDPNVYVRNPRTYTRTSEQTVFPGDHTGIARYDTAQLDAKPYVTLLFDLPCAI